MRKKPPGVSPSHCLGGKKKRRWENLGIDGMKKWQRRIRSHRRPQDYDRRGPNSGEPRGRSRSPAPGQKKPAKDQSWGEGCYKSKKGGENGKDSTRKGGTETGAGNEGVLHNTSNGMTAQMPLLRMVVATRPKEGGP